MKKLLLAAALLAAPVLAQDAEPKGEPSPGEIVAAAPASEWVTIAPQDLLVMTLAPDRDGHERRVVIQLMPPPFSQPWVANIRTLAHDHWYDGNAITRVQDNYVAQWGDPNGDDKAKARTLPEGLGPTSVGEYETKIDGPIERALQARLKAGEESLSDAFAKRGADKVLAIKRAIPRDPYSDETLDFKGWPVAVDRQSQTAWPIHCYAMVGVGRGYAPDAGSGAELYAVIGQAPRHLDRNIALVGRVIEGIENLSSLPRGTGPLGVYEDPAQQVPIASIRLASELPADQQPHFEYLSTEGATFAKYVDARANRRDPFFIVPAGGVDICNVPVPVRRVP